MIQPVLQPQEPPKRTILTVSQLNRQAKSTLESNLGSIWLTGEISNLTKAASGHWYFSLKDEQAQIRCAMFKFKAQTVRFAPKEGDKVVVKGKVSLYEARGDYQLIVDFMEPAGLGNLQQQLNELIQKLRQAGLFDDDHKKPLPGLPKQIGVITSPTGAAIQDVLTVLQRRCPMVPVVIYPTQVQGATATDNIIEAIDIAEKRNECDVLLITRGGGSLEDLWCFNHEKLAYRIFDCEIPVVAAVGHEVDTTVAELVADLRAATPSAAAELLVPDQQALQQDLDLMSINLANRLQVQINQLKNRLEIARLKLSDPQNAIKASQLKLEGLQAILAARISEKNSQSRSRLDALDKKLQSLNPEIKLKQAQSRLSQNKLQLVHALENQITRLNNRFKVTVGSLETLSPLSTLSRGYSIAKDPQSGKVINKTEQLKQGMPFKLLVTDGEADCKVEAIHPQKHD